MIFCHYIQLREKGRKKTCLTEMHKYRPREISPNAIISLSLSSGGEIYRAVVKEMFVNIRWSTVRYGVCMQVSNGFYQNNHWP